jgi:superoxide reductase
MAEQKQIYKCEVCGNIIEVLHGGQGDLVCCGQNMKLFEEKQGADEGKEKHVPVIEAIDGGVKVKVGSNPHPMEEKHYIEWIELCVGDQCLYRMLKPGDEPVATFCVKGLSGPMKAREFCNLHGLWAAEA